MGSPNAQLPPAGGAGGGLPTGLTPPPKLPASPGSFNMGTFGNGPTAPAPANFGAPLDRSMSIAGRTQNIPRRFISGPGQQGPFGGGPYNS